MKHAFEVSTPSTATFAIAPAVATMSLLPDTHNWGLRMRRECRERFPRHRVQRSRHAPWHVCDARAVMHAGIAN